ncbi:MAG: hypothetical protein V1800_10550 [Candidatus Latescibacterota bacterium]
MRIKKLPCVFLLLSLGCATYYTQSIKFQEHFVRGELEQAAKVLDKNKRAAKDKNRLLYFLQKGVVLQMLGKFEESNRFFEEAYLFAEDIQKNYAAEAFGLLSNPAVMPYKGEDFERVQIHYYKALNCLKLGQFEEALVECRRIDIKLNSLNDKYSNRKNRYKTDAFALNLMGMIFEASGDHNSAFISYRNAYEAYEKEYKPSFGVETPLQLKKDLLRSAYLNGFTEELDRYETLFGLKYVPPVGEGGHLVFFWHNGLGPVKDEWSINFFLVRGKGGLVTFANEELGLSFPFLLDGGSGKTSTELGDLKFIRAAFPKYLERKPYFRSAEVVVSGETYPLEFAQNINEIALKTLEDRMVRELSHSLLRLAVKQASEQAVRKKNENLGALLSVANAISEKTDTRNWQTLPYSISYARFPLPVGERCSIELRTYSPRKSRASSVTFQVEGEPGETLFWVYHTLESLPLER